MPLTRTTNADLATTIDENIIMAADEWNKLTDGVDRQVHAAMDRLAGSGVLAGWAIQSSKEVTAGAGIVDGFVGVTAALQAITGLVNGTTNTVWAVRVDSATPGDSVTFTDGIVAFQASAVPPPHSTLLGTITLDGGGTVTAIDNTPDGRVTIIPLGTEDIEGSVDIVGLTVGNERWVDVDHSATLEFRAVLLLEILTATSGFTVNHIENCQPGQWGCLVTNDSGYYNDCTVTYRRRGVRA